MYVVVFKARINALDTAYFETAEQMRQLAISDYGCTEFTACTEGDKEIAISYWPSLEQIKAWHCNPQHRAAQRLGKERWYKSYEVDIAKVLP